jgi:transcription initiation factor TFIIIB Brf1 subunit/transcription initiation factor TFIIB
MSTSSSPDHSSIIAPRLDKKEEKKLQKFMEHLDEYSEALKIVDNQALVEKYKELATLVIPRVVSHFKGKPFEAISAAILLHSCREIQYPVTIRQIVMISDAKEKLINKCIMSLKEIMPEKEEGEKQFNAGELIEMIAGKLSAP